MSGNGENIKAVGGIAPLGYRWRDGKLVVDEREAQTRKLIYELFLKHRRKKTVARLLNDLGYRTRSGARFSDTTVDRLLRDPTAKGVRIVDGREIKVEPIISEELWKQANSFLKTPQAKQPVSLFAGVLTCDCGGKMNATTNHEKYTCEKCRHKIKAEDLEEIFEAQLPALRLDSENDGDRIEIADYWNDLSNKEKRLLIEQLVSQISVGRTRIKIEFAIRANSLKTPQLWQQSITSNETLHSQPKSETKDDLSEPLMNETQAAKFLGISRMTLLRKRKAREIGFYRVGFRVLYSKEKHLIPFLKQCEK